MNKNLLTGMVAAAFVLSFVAAASGNEHHAAVAAPVVSNAAEKGPHVRVWKKLTESEGAVEEQVHRQAAVVEVKEAVKTPAKVAHPKVLKKSETAAAELEARKLKELQAKFTKAESTVKALQKKLSLAEKQARVSKELQVKLAKAESANQMLEKKASRAGQHTQGTKELQPELTKAKLVIRQLQQKLALTEKQVQGSEQLQAKLVKAELLIKELRAKCAGIEAKDRQTKELQAKLGKAESALQDLKEKLKKSALTIRKLHDQVAAADAGAVQVEAKASTGCESLRAQIIGYERIIGEKDAALKKIGNERDHWKINKNILLSKITEQRAGLEKLQEEHNALLRDFAAREKECVEANGSSPAADPQQ
jgi:DNA repair exonuclease SbcCD ATPase subunit